MSKFSFKNFYDDVMAVAPLTTTMMVAASTKCKYSEIQVTTRSLRGKKKKKTKTKQNKNKQIKHIS